ncbi:MAG: toll/interleukin-1 receptor domain-containing protein [Woronichinia naegeliana WA131]|jgi:hypothetical protein|uniref:Toll/interleukin-1 receptor domain-containing protein n=1 Tax=Woronichinia naegeliana WA131 TaxID=2824559 RepID=A0A977KUL8_9CYAN|nr:MAG: toll/interleukin-1 receptor domain-containing protein [Woronichinia naegeliana WA131]
MQNWDVFICHSSNDKKSFVEPLSIELKKLGVRVWFDKFVLVPGDRLSEKIAEGLATTRSGVLVISKSFIGKPWTRYELSGLVNRFVEENTRLIPIWLDVNRSDVAKLNPSLADLLSIVSDSNNIKETALEILRTIRPQLYKNLIDLSQIEANSEVFETRYIENFPIADLKIGPIRYHDLDKALLIRIQNLWFAMRQLLDTSLEQWIEGFQRDLRPEKEVVIWERILSALNLTMEKLTYNDDDSKAQAYKIILSFSLGSVDSVFEKARKGEFDFSIVQATTEAWLNTLPQTTISDVEDKGL